MQEKEKVLIAILPLNTHNFFRCAKHGLFAQTKHIKLCRCSVCGEISKMENITPEMVLEFRHELRLK